MKNYICVYDFETDSPDPLTTQPVQLAACMLHPITLDIVEGSEWCSWMRPVDIKDDTYLDEHMDTIVWHTKNYNPNFGNMSQDERDEAVKAIYTTWLEAPDQDQVFKNFANYLLEYNSNQSRRTKFGAPIRAGANIRNFDNLIIDRLSKLYGQSGEDGKTKMFHPRDIIDITEISFLWFESLPEPKRYNMDTLREFFGLETVGAHDALKDIRDEAWMIQRYMKLFRRYAKSVKFKGAASKDYANSH